MLITLLFLALAEKLGTCYFIKWANNVNRKLILT